MMLRVRYGSILLSTPVMLLAFAAGLVLAESSEKTSAKDKTNAPEIQKGATVKIEYTLTDEKGKVLDTSKGREPLTYVHGEGQIIPGLEKALRGLHAGDSDRRPFKEGSRKNCGADDAKCAGSSGSKPVPRT